MCYKIFKVRFKYHLQFCAATVNMLLTFSVKQAATTARKKSPFTT